MTEWIKCSERMPEHCKTVLVNVITCHNGWDKDVRDAYWHESAKAWFREGSDDFYRVEEVTHWMPLPELPNEI